MNPLGRKGRSVKGKEGKLEKRGGGEREEGQGRKERGEGNR